MAYRVALVLLVILIWEVPDGWAQRVGAGSEAPTPRVFADAVEESRALLDSLMERETVPGLTVAVSVEGVGKSAEEAAEVALDRPIHIVKR